MEQQVTRRWMHRQDEPAENWRIELPEPVPRGAVVRLDDEMRADYFEKSPEGILFGPAIVWVDARTVEIRFHQPVTGAALVIY